MRAPITVPRAALLCCALACLCGCGSTSGDELAWKLDTLASCARSAQSVLAAFSARSVPASYAQRALASLSDESASLADDIERSGAPAAAPNAQAVQLARVAAAAMRAGSASVERADRESAGAARASLATTGAALLAMSTTLSARPR